jgi:stage IV sporulation protein FB
MGWEDRPYYRDRSRSTSPLMWLLSGSVPMFTAFGIRVRAHASLLIFILFWMIFDAGMGYSIEARAISMGIFTAIIVLHEFGHCFMARWLGGTADDVMLTPLGGLAMANPPHRPMASFLTSAAGPAVNVVLCAICAVIIREVGGKSVSFNPFNWAPPITSKWNVALIYVWFVFMFSYTLLLFNLLPIFPLDGGQMLQAILWPQVGHYRSMMIATTTGMIGSAVLGLFALYHFAFMLLLLAGFLFYGCYQRRMILRESGDEWSDQADYSQSLYANPEAPRRRRNRRAANRARKIARQEAAERQQIDAILAKVSAKGMHTLNWFERRALRKATERQRRRNLELSRLQ